MINVYYISLPGIVQGAFRPFSPHESDLVRIRPVQQLRAPPRFIRFEQPFPPQCLHFLLQQTTVFPTTVPTPL